MSTPYVAKLDQWANIEKFVSDYGYNSCLLELRARVEALEAGATCPHVRTSDENTSYCTLAEQVAAVESAAPAASSLVERVAGAAGLSHVKARAAIREVAAWLRDRGGYPWAWVAQTLEQEVD